ncbi:MAG: AmmeMemoRadiSam system protein B [Armatimonadota bacterium]
MPGVRQPAVAGQFYEGTKEALAASIERCFLHHLGPGMAPAADTHGPGLIGAVISPHAGYMYSGPAAARAYRALAADGIPETIVIVGPSHYTANRRAAISLADVWRTPLGDVAVDVELGEKLMAASPLFEADEAAHRDEHSLEVQLPFLQFVYGRRMPKILPICIRSHPLEEVEGLAADAQVMGEAIGRAIRPSRAAVVASTDFSHQVPQEVAERQDRLALDAIEAMDPGGLLKTVRKHRISMCGPAPVAVALWSCLARGEFRAELLVYYTSGDIIGDRRAVVGYASLAVRRQGGGG